MPKHHCVHWSGVDTIKVSPEIVRQIITGNNMMMVRLQMKKGCVVPLHQHPHEQITFIQKGRVKFWIDGQETLLETDGVAYIPSNVSHKVEALEDSLLFDIFNPPREDFLTK
ncbi:MAG TPA: cupin domain-containing protein [Terriglobia bacterium]|nr:cupin domain-containing protein [Terriglobia bacterium]